jgi:cardiolipin hydrolase
MTPAEIDAWLVASLDDRRLSRGERQVLSASLGVNVDREALRRRAFELARSSSPQPAELLVLQWLEDVLKTIRDDAQADSKPLMAEAHFSPGDDCPRAIEQFLFHAKQTADICVFTITDDRLAEAVLDTHRRRLAVRIITDDSKAEDLGSDIDRFERAGIPLRVDRSPFHMHHKFAVVDGESLLTGSYNWTRGAARDNEENLIITNELGLVASFRKTFDRLWAKLA